jgi:hypothetical protein
MTWLAAPAVVGSDPCRLVPLKLSIQGEPLSAGGIVLPRTESERNEHD